jgi:hypothetical protein
MRLLARTIHGIETVVADELRQRGLGRVHRLRHREVWFTTPTPGPRLLTVRTADDPTSLWRELRRVLAPHGRAVLLLHDLTAHLDRLHAARLHPDAVRPLSLAGTHPAIVTLRPR